MVVEAARRLMAGLLPVGRPVLAGVSGGVDSMVLLDVLRVLGYPVHAAHVNYGLRPGAADADEALVSDVCAGLCVPLAIHRADPEAMKAASGSSLQEVAREIRYAFFERVAREQGIEAVAVGHHRDDQAETVLLNLMRGSGLEGLSGMPPSRPLRSGASCRLVRPLLTCSRTDLLSYARRRGLRWREDASNASGDYVRNVLRREILPRMDALGGPGVGARIARAADVLRGYRDGPFRDALERDLAACRAGDGALALPTLRRHPTVWRQRLLLEALARWLPGAPRSAHTARALDDLCAAPTGRRLQFAGGAVWRDRERLRFVPAAPSGPVGVVPVTPGVPVVTAGATVRVEVDVPPPAGGLGTEEGVEYADADAIPGPLTLRPWAPGDRFRPLGMKGHKKVSDLLTDARTPPHERRDVLVLCSGGDIVWVVGCRLADRVRVRPGTTRWARLSCSFPVKSTDMTA